MSNILNNFQRWAKPGFDQAKSFVILVCGLIVLIAAVPHSQAFAAKVEILTPQTEALIIARNPETHLVLRQALIGKSNIVRVRKSGSVIQPIAVSDNGTDEYLHFRLPLESGVNNFTIEPGGQRIELHFEPVQSELGLKRALGKKVSLFHQDDNLPANCQDCHDLKETRTLAPVGLKQDSSCFVCHENIVDKGSWQHSTTINQQCLVCHQQSGESGRIGFPNVNIQDICLACHTGKRIWLSQPFIHGPVTVGGCTICHNPHGENNRYQLFAQGALELCVACHGDKENLVTETIEDRLPYVHGVISGEGGCVACHEPHATDQPFMLKKPINELCSGCHSEVISKSKGHPVANHPVSAPRERLRPGRKLTCTSCHDPHGSINQLMLVQSPLGGRLCRECHAR
jgi:predicted CXXCH cytochrome family protein